MNVRKSDGSYEEFDREKVKNGICDAYVEAGEECNEILINSIVDNLFLFDKIDSSEIRRQVEDALMSINKKVAKEYIKKFVSDSELKKRGDFITSYINATNASTGSKYDSNANVANKNIATLNAEIPKFENIMFNRKNTSSRIKKLYSNKLAKQYIDDLENHIIYKHDESSFGINSPYCVAIQSYPFLTDGLKGLGGLSAAPKNIDSYCGMFVNLIFAVSSQFAGAVACSGFFNMFDYFARKEWGDDYYKESNSFYKIGYKLRKLLNKTHYWTNNVVELSEHDFGDEEMNKLRDEIVYESTRQLTEEELKTYIENIKKDPNYVFHFGDGTRTIKGQIYQYFQQVVYGINQPAAARGFQSAFVNFGYFDKPYFEGMYGEFVFPDNTRPQWESVSFIQKTFMKWFNAERTRCVLTFPVETMSLLYRDGEYVDKEYAEFTAEMLSEGHSFFIYTSDSPDTLSSCCFSKDQKVLWKSSTGGVNLTTLEELHNAKWETEKKNLRIFHNGSWVNGKTVKLSNRKMYKVVTENNKEFYMTDNHINVTAEGEKTTDKLSTNDYLMFNTMALNAISENDEHLTYEQGFVIGAFLGDGSFGSEVNGTIYSINFSQNEKKYEKMMDMIDKANKQVGGDSFSCLRTVYNNVYPVEISSKRLASFIMKWTNWHRGVYAYNKELNLNCLLQSVEFRKGILDGWYNTDGGNTNRCYTTSKKLVECMEALITSLGMQSIINVSNRTTEICGSKVVIREKEYNRNYPLYCVRWYEPVNNRKNKNKGNSWIKKNNSIYFKIKSIEPFEYNEDVYCIECNNEDEPYFTLPSGLITHNCRLSNKIQENTFTFTNGLTGEQTGSKSVITLNFNRIMQNFVNEHYNGEADSFNKDKQEFMDGFKKYLQPILERVYKYHTAYNDILWELYNANMLPVYSAGFIHLNRQYLTLGINGLNEAWMFLGGKCNYNKDYLYFTSSITGFMKQQNAIHKTRKELFNTEFVPAESLGIKNYKWDKNDGYWVPEGRNCYTSYFFLPDDDEISILDKMKLHGKENVESIDGGSACHLQLMEHLSIEQYRKLLDFAGKVGCNYWTVNVKNSECKNCGYISKHTIKKCPKCGSEDFDYWTRIIGYLRKVSDFNEGRQIEESKRVYS